MIAATHRNGYMNGAKTDPEENTIRAPKISNTKTSGMSHHFFSCRKNSRNSLQSCHMLAAF